MYLLPYLLRDGLVGRIACTVVIVFFGGFLLSVGVACACVSILTSSIAFTRVVGSSFCCLQFEFCLIRLYALVGFVVRLCGLIWRWVLLFRSQVEHRLLAMHQLWPRRSCTYKNLFTCPAVPLGTFHWLPCEVICDAHNINYAGPHKAPPSVYSLDASP